MRSTRWSTLRRWIAPLVVATISAGMIATGLSEDASAHRKFGYYYSAIGSDGLWNWDFRNSSTRKFADKDWPVHLIFWNNATVRRVKGTDGTHRLDNDKYKTTGGKKWARFNDDGFWEYDDDKGRKRFNCKFAADYNKWTDHYRVYADKTYDFNWTAGFNYYVLVTTHWDYDDPEIGGGCNNAQFGWDEWAEDEVRWHYTSWSGGPRWTFEQDAVHLHNDADYDEYLDGNLHRRSSDGSATKIKVP